MEINKEIINIATGEVKKGNAKNILVSNGIGSCIVVAAINHQKQIGGMAHIMLPGKAPLKETQSKTKYTEDAIETLLQLLEIPNYNTSFLKVCLIGAGNVLKKPDDTICISNIYSLLTVLKDLRIKISAASLGGDMRRTVRFNIETGEVYQTIGDSGPTLVKRWHIKDM